jgi:hypothetical protein
VEKTRKQFEDAQKRSPDVQKQIPQVQPGEAFWSAEQSAYFVKCAVSGPPRKWNLALKKDPKTGRWFVDGGI